MAARIRREQPSDAAQLLERQPAALAVLAPDGTILHWNRSAERLFGYAAAEALGRDFESLLVPAERREERREVLRHALAAGSACYTTDRTAKDGSTVAVKVFVDVGAGEDAGHLFVTQRAIRNVHCLCGTSAITGARRPAKALTTRQVQVLSLIAEGRSTREIAGRLGLSAKTVETHRGHLMQRLRLRSVAGLVRYAVSVGLVPTSPWSVRSGKDAV